MYQERIRKQFMSVNAGILTSIMIFMREVKKFSWYSLTIEEQGDIILSS